MWEYLQIRNIFFFQQDESPNPLASLLFTNAKKETWGKSQDWVESENYWKWIICQLAMTRRRKTAVYNEYRWQVCVRLNDPDSMSYFHISDTSSRGRNESMKVVELWKRNNQPHNSEDVFLCCLMLFSSSPKRQNSFKISIIYHQMKFVVYVQVYLYTPSGEHKSGSSN